MTNVIALFLALVCISAQNTVTFWVFTDDQCTIPAITPGGASSETMLDITIECQETPDASVTEVTCFEDRIMYVNHPNTKDCSAEPKCNEIPIGECTHFPGPVPSWKFIYADTYTCLSENPVIPSVCDTTTGGPTGDTTGEDTTASGITTGGGNTGATIEPESGTVGLGGFWTFIFIAAGVIALGFIAYRVRKQQQATTKAGLLEADYENLDINA